MILLLKFDQTEPANMAAALEFVSHIATGQCQFANSEIHRSPTGRQPGKDHSAELTRSSDWKSLHPSSAQRSI
jgi:hypothetical protein